MTTQLLEVSAVATIDADEYTLRPGSSARLDSAAVPYGVASLELPMLSDLVLDALDPRDGARVQLEHSVNGTPRAFDMLVRERTADHRAKTVSVSLATDEVMLQKYAALSTDVGARAHAASCRAVVDYVLGKIGASLEPGGTDADVTPYWEASNLMPDPSFETGTTAGWAASTGAPTLANVGTFAFVGTRSLSVTATAVGGLATISPVVRAVPGQSYGGSLYVRSSVSRSATVTMRFTNQAGGTTDFASAAAATSTTGFTRLSVLAVAPADAVSVRVFFTANANAIGNIHYLDAVMISPDTEILPFFYGTTPADAFYTYANSGGAGVRTPIIDRPREMFTWKPGIKAWDFLIAITASVGLVLWCDESRAWWLATPVERTVPGLVSITDSNTSDGTDTISLDDDETTPTGVVVKYTWPDAAGVRREAYDSAGTPDRPHVVELEGAYPGPGTAAAMLTRRQGSGRRQDVRTITQITTTPGMTGQLTLPAAPTTIGRVAAVEFDLATGFMTLDLAGLVDIIPGSIAALVGTIDSLVGTIDSL